MPLPQQKPQHLQQHLQQSNERRKLIMALQQRQRSANSNYSSTSKQTADLTTFSTTEDEERSVFTIMNDDLPPGWQQDNEQMQDIHDLGVATTPVTIPLQQVMEMDTMETEDEPDIQIRSSHTDISEYCAEDAASDFFDETEKVLPPQHIQPHQYHQQQQGSYDMTAIDDMEVATSSYRTNNSNSNNNLNDGDSTVMGELLPHENDKDSNDETKRIMTKRDVIAIRTVLVIIVAIIISTILVVTQTDQIPIDKLLGKGSSSSEQDTLDTPPTNPTTGNIDDDDDDDDNDQGGQPQPTPTVEPNNQTMISTQPSSSPSWFRNPPSLTPSTFQPTISQHPSITPSQSPTCSRVRLAENVKCGNNRLFRTNDRPENSNDPLFTRLDCIQLCLNTDGCQYIAYGEGENQEQPSFRTVCIGCPSLPNVPQDGFNAYQANEDPCSTLSPTASPTANPTSTGNSPKDVPLSTMSPTVRPTPFPTVGPTSSPSRASPTVSPTALPTTAPTITRSESPTASPSTSPTASPSSSQSHCHAPRFIQTDTKCASDSTRTFRLGNETDKYTLERCNQACLEDTNGCVYFSLGDEISGFHGVCIGCSSPANPDPNDSAYKQSGFDYYEANNVCTSNPTVSPTSSPSVSPTSTNHVSETCGEPRLIDTDKKCPFGGGDRIFREESNTGTPFTLQQCRQLCLDTAGCNYISFGENLPTSSSLYKVCIGCAGPANPPDEVAYQQTGFNYYDASCTTASPTTSPTTENGAGNPASPSQSPSAV